MKNCTFFFKDFILFMINIERGRERQREKQAPSWEPDVGLNPGTPGLCSGPKAGAKPLSHPGILKTVTCFTSKRWVYLAIKENCDPGQNHRQIQETKKRHSFFKRKGVSLEGYYELQVHCSKLGIQNSE